MNPSLNSNQKKFVELITDEYIYTNEDLSEMIGVDVRTIYRWKHNQSITDEINKQADASLGQYIYKANRTLTEVIENGTEAGQLKAIEMLYKSMGKYKEQTDVNITETKTVDEKKASLLTRLKG